MTNDLNQKIPADQLPEWAEFGTWHPHYGSQAAVKPGYGLKTDMIAGLCQTGCTVKFNWWRGRLRVCVYKRGADPQEKLFTRDDPKEEADDADR